MGIFVKYIPYHTVTRYRTLWTCSDCGATAGGDNVTIEVKGEPFTPSRPDLQHIPVTWAAYGNAVKCPACQ